jgi:hypothetical protein
VTLWFDGVSEKLFSISETGCLTKSTMLGVVSSAVLL